MKKKFTYGLLLLTSVCLGCNFTACKDTEDDLRAEMNSQDDALLKLINALKQAQEECKTNCKTQFEDVLKKLDGKADATTLSTLQTNFNSLVDRLGDGQAWTKDGIQNIVKEMMGGASADDIKDIVTNIADINTELDKVFGDNGLSSKVETLTTNYETLKGQVGTLNTALGQIYGMISTTNTKVSELKTAVDGLGVRLGKAEQDAFNALTQAQTNSTKIQTIYDLIGDTEGLGSFADEIRALKAKDDELQQQLDKVFGEGGLNDQFGQLKVDFETLKGIVDANKTAIDEINTKLERLTDLENRVNSLITSMIVQGVYNPLFGTFSLPIGVQSNMLISYYGYSDKQNYTFPSTQQIASVDNEPQLTADEYAVLQASGLTGEQIENGAVLIDSKDDNLGRVFVTINPNNIDFTGGDLTLVNSKDDPCTVKLKNLQRSEEVLTFGYSRAANNGFYQADVYLEPNLDAINDVKVEIDPKLKSAMKDILTDGRRGLRTNALHLMKALYDQFNGFLPAYGLKAGWTVNNQPYAVYSNYNIAATTFRPLSYNFLRGESFGDKFPTIDPINQAIINLNPDDYKFDFSDVKVNINGDDVKLNFTIKPIEIKYDGTLKAEVSGNVYGTGEHEGEIIGTVTATGEVSEADMNKFLGDIENSINGSIGSWNTELESAFRQAIDQMLGKVNTAVDDMLIQMQGKINDKISSIIGSIQDEVNGKVGSYIGKFNSFIERYNSIAGRLNNFLKNPNYYMQPAAFYEGSSARDFLLSTNPANPTVLVNEGGDGFMIYATSFNAEVIAPAYKKVVAVTDVIDNATGKRVADAQSQCVAINRGSEFLASVQPGNLKRFAIPTSGMKAGYTYEILYTAVDYTGVTATARYYVTVR